jgi:hypothetical protein
MCALYAVGTKVQGIPSDSCKFTGTVVGYGFVKNVPMMIVELSFMGQGYLSNEGSHHYVSHIIVHPDNAVEAED